MLTDAVIKQWFNAIRHRDPGPAEYVKFRPYEFGKFISLLVDWQPESFVFPFLWPVGGPKIVNVPFHSARYRARFGRTHDGVDINVHNNGRPTGLDEPILNAAPGRVIATGYDNGWGNRVIVQHRHNVRTLYAHLHTMNVHPGWFVNRGHVLGPADSSGFSTGNHLHFELLIKNTILNFWYRVDPLTRLPRPDSIYDL